MVTQARTRFGNSCRPQPAVVHHSGSMVVAGATYNRVTCPKCKTEFLMMRGMRKGTCPECGERVLLRAGDYVRPSKETR